MRSWRWWLKRCVVAAAVTVGVTAAVRHDAVAQVAARGGRQTIDFVSMLTNAIFNRGGSGSVNRTALSKMSDVLSAVDQGVICNGTSDDAPALASASAAAVSEGRTLLIDCKVRVASAAGSLGAALKFEGAGALDVSAAGGSVTVSGPLTAPLSQIFFTGAGTLTFSAKVPAVYPQWWGAKGDGVADDTAAIQAAIQAAPVGGRVLLAGTYKYSTTLLITASQIHIVGIGSVGASLNFVGNGNAVMFDGGASSGYLFGASLENVLITGTASATNALVLRSVHHSVFRNVRVANVTASGLLMNFAVANLFDSFRCSVNEGAFSVTPVNGIYGDRRNVNENTNANTFINPIIEGVSGSGIKLVYGLNNTFVGGTSEQNLNGFELLANSARNTIIDVDCELNTGEDYIILSAYNTLSGVLAGSSASAGAAGAIHLSGVSALQNSITGGEVNWIKIDSGSNTNRLIGVAYNVQGNGGFTDNGTATLKVANANVSNVTPDPTVIPGGVQSPGGIDMPTAANLNIGTGNASGVTLGRSGGSVNSAGSWFTARVVPTYGASVVINAGLGNEFVITPTGGAAFMVANPTNPNTGQRITIRVRNTFGVLGALTFDTLYRAAAWTQPANGFSRSIDFQYDGTNWIEVSRTPSDVPN